MWFPIIFSLLTLLAAVTATTSTVPKPIRIAFFVTKSPNITEAEFHHHWSTHHGPMVTPWLKRSGIIEYNQFHAPSAQKGAIAPLVAPGSPIGTYDGYAEFLVPTVAIFQAAFKDPFYAKNVAPDEDYLFDKKAFMLLAGYRQVFWHADFESSVVDDGKFPD